MTGCLTSCVPCTPCYWDCTGSRGCPDCPGTPCCSDCSDWRNDNDEVHFKQYYNDAKEQGVLLTLANDGTDENGELRFLSGWLFEKGVSVPKNIEEAKKLYSQSEKKGFPLSTKYLKRIS